MILYYELGPDKKLNEIVMAGSHDAGITEGGKNIQTQNLDICGQATAGVRIFDLRITGAVVKKGEGGTVTTLKSYHGGSAKSTGQKIDLRTGQTQDVTVTKMSKLGVTTGEYGMTLTKILSDAQKFVSINPSEFLILKFDKCTNWLMIAEACVALLGTSLYKGGGNLNIKTLRELQGKVIVVFTSEGQKAVHHLYGIPQGILGIKNLYGSGAVYDPDFHGLQYFGKGGTAVHKPFKKIDQNIKKQSKIMTKGGEGNPEVMGMMYWTTTGIFESIKKRNDTMWTQPKVQKLQNMWDNGLNNAIMSRVNTEVATKGFAGGYVFKAFMPNFIMIDFADDRKCTEIFELNTIP
nr:hypothetical protein [Pirellulaceae bacterium]